jgi:hypothetical protein
MVSNLDSDTEAQDTAPPPPARHRELHINALLPRAPRSATPPPRASPRPREPPSRPTRELLHPLVDVDFASSMASYDDPQDLLDPSTTSDDDVEASADYEPPQHSTTQSPLIAPSYPATMPTTKVAPPPPAPLALTYDPVRRDRASRYRNPVQHTSPAAARSTAAPTASPQADMPKAPASYKVAMLSPHSDQ